MTVPPWPIVPIFQSTLPGWGATARHAAQRAGQGISIHAPRMGSDWSLHGSCPACGYFNPRSPDGERLHEEIHVLADADFNPRSPDGERQAIVTCDIAHVHISIHAPRMGSDSAGLHQSLRTGDFNPRSPDGERLRSSRSAVSLSSISIHAPRMGSDSRSLRRHPHDF